MDHIKSFERVGSDLSIDIGPVCGRKRIAIAVVRGSIHSVVAYARSEEAALELVEAMRELTGARTDV
jgi:hypothetical protein